MLRGKTHSFVGGKHTQLARLEVFRKWRILPTKVEVALRKVKWLQACLANPAPNEQVVAVVWGEVLGSRTLREDGSLAPDANPFAASFAESLEMFRGLGGTEDFFELWEECDKSRVELLCVQDSDVGDALCRMDVKILRAAFCTGCKGPWDYVKEAEPVEGKAGFVCKLALGDGTCCGQNFKSKQALIMHQVKSGEECERGNLHPVVRCSSANMCHSTFASNICAKHHLGASYLHGSCIPGRSTFDWEVFGSASAPWKCELCECVCENFFSFQRTTANIFRFPCQLLTFQMPATLDAEELSQADASTRGSGPRHKQGRANREKEIVGGEKSSDQKELKFAGSAKKLMALIIKMVLSLAQGTRDIEGAVLDTLLGECGLAEVLAMQEQGAVYQKKAVIERPFSRSPTHLGVRGTLGSGDKARRGCGSGEPRSAEGFSADLGLGRCGSQGGYGSLLQGEQVL